MAVYTHTTNELCPDCDKHLKAYRKGHFRRSKWYYCPECGFTGAVSALDYKRTKRRLERIEREADDRATAALASLAQGWPYAELANMKQVADKLEGVER